MKFSNESLPIDAEEMFSISNSWVPETGNKDRIILGTIIECSLFFFEGQYACKLINVNMNSTKTSTLDTDLILWAETDDGKVSSEKQIIKFLPGVHVDSVLILHETSSTGELSINGLPEVLNQLSVRCHCSFLAVF